MRTRIFFSACAPAVLMMLPIALAVLPAELPAQQDDSWRTDFEKHTVPLEEITSGGPPKDGIPAIDEPNFVSVREADRWLGDSEPVAVVELNGEVKAYPLQILIWHEIVNDVVGSKPVTVTYCPLCNTTLAFARGFDGRVLDFGTTGRLRHSDMVMYDRQTETWWQQATGEAIVGEYAGQRLDFIPAPLISWGTFSAEFPDALVLSRETGHDRPYGRNPYQGYDSEVSPMRAFFRRQVDDRLPAMERIVALELGEEVRAYPFSSLSDVSVMNDRVAGRDIVVLWAPGTASAVDHQSIAEGRDVGSSGVFDRRVDGRTLVFEASGDGRYRDRQTGSTWNILGRALSGPLEGRRLTPIQHGNHFWFAWAVFRPNVEVVR